MVIVSNCGEHIFKADRKCRERNRVSTDTQLLRWRHGNNYYDFGGLSVKVNTLIFGLGHTLLGNQGVEVHAVQALPSTNPVRVNVEYIDKCALSSASVEPFEGDIPISHRRETKPSEVMFIACFAKCVLKNFLLIGFPPQILSLDICNSMPVVVSELTKAQVLRWTL